MSFLKSIVRRAADFYFLPVRRSQNLRTYLQGSLLTDPEQHLTSAMRYIKKHVTPAPDEIVIDVGGANGGTATLFAAAFPGHKVFCVEPNARMLPLLKKAEAEHPTVVVKPLALGRQGGEATLHVTANNLSSSLNEIDQAELKQTPSDFQARLHEDQQITVRVSTLDEEFPNQQVLLIKLDTQGTEAEILKGGPRTLERTRFVLVEMNNHHLYRNTCQYYEVDELLRNHSFKLADIIVTYRGDDGVSEYDALYRNLNL
ncbi:MAG TPA: FkbM family methyltransferase [Pyrinomonadaceae bacterium]|nr:FkbM family methyltransferase [Pyrinomonadaceae bacterium]